MTVIEQNSPAPVPGNLTQGTVGQGHNTEDWNLVWLDLPLWLIQGSILAPRI